jgi:hypothetical protein
MNANIYYMNAYNNKTANRQKQNKPNQTQFQTQFVLLARPQEKRWHYELIGDKIVGNLLKLFCIVVELIVFGAVLYNLGIGG